MKSIMVVDCLGYPSYNEYGHVIRGVRVSWHKNEAGAWRPDLDENGRPKYEIVGKPQYADGHQPKIIINSGQAQEKIMCPACRAAYRKQLAKIKRIMFKPDYAEIMLKRYREILNIKRDPSIWNILSEVKKTEYNKILSMINNIGADMCIDKDKILHIRDI